MQLNIFSAVVASVLGVVFGSFANVVIWRLPREESLSHPGSHCPRCATPIRWSDNVPVVSWILLRGRCRACAERISRRYPLVEAASGLLFLLAWLMWGVSARAVFAAAFFYLLLILAMIDLDTRRLPNVLVGVLGLLGLVGAVLSAFTDIEAAPLIEGGGPLGNPFVFALTGAFASAGLALGIATLYSLLRDQTGFGMGDVKLLAAIGTFLGVYGVLVLFVASMLGVIPGILAARSKGGVRAAKIPFGPFLALASVVVALWGPTMWAWYTGFLV